MISHIKMAAFIAVIFSLFASNNSLAANTDYWLNHNIRLTLVEQTINSKQQAELNSLISDTLTQLDTNNPESILNQLNQHTEAQLPNWFFRALVLCEQWHDISEGRFTCRNGQLKQYWKQVVAGTIEIERREVRKLARSARVADVEINRDTQQVVFEQQVSWDFSDIHEAVVLYRLTDVLNDLGVDRFHVRHKTMDVYAGDDYRWEHQHSDKKAAKPLFLENTVSFTFSPWGHTVFSGSDTQGVISHNDGWPAAMFASHVLATNAIDAAVIAYLGASTPSRELFSLLKPDSQHVQLSDESNRIYSTENYAAAVSPGQSTVNAITIGVTLPSINVADYQGPYVTVWVTDSKNNMIKNLLIRGTGESWLKTLRVWWRRVGRKNDQLIDGMSGATNGNRPISLFWDGLNQFGEPVSQDDLMLHVEAVREHGGRTYEQIPFRLSSLIAEPVSIKSKNEISRVTVSVDSH